MLNIEFQISGILLVILSGFFYSRLPKLKLRTTRAFGCMIPIAVAAAVFDIASVFAIYYADRLLDGFVKAVCKLYLVVLMSLVLFDFIYICADAFSDKRIFKRITGIVGIVFCVAMTAALFLPIEYVCENGGQVIYSEGPFTLACYGIYAVVFVAMFFIMIIRRSKIHRRRKLSVWIWLLSLLIAVVVQFFNSSLLLVTFAECMDILILFLMIENPEFYIDKGSGFFHVNAMPRYLKEVYAKDRCFVINTRYQISEDEFFETVEHADIFVGTGEIYLIFAQKEHFDTELQRISEQRNKRSIYVCEEQEILADVDNLQATFRKMQELKRVGRAAHFRYISANIYRIDSEVMALFKERTEAKAIVAKAISADGAYKIEPFFQPIYSMKTGRFSSAEALARIRDSEGGIIPPAKFIPIAEENGSIVELGRIMFDEVCAFLSGIDDLGLNYVEVNLSVVQGEDEHLADDICATMEKYQISPDQINLEITETSSIQGREQLLNSMNQMIQKGLHFSLDDFGTGQSNLDYMAVMPVSIVKFDHSITQSYFVLDKTKSVVRAAVRMIHDMGMQVVIEGIETAEQFEEMKTLGVDYIQGYYFSKPLPGEEFIAFLRRHNLESIGRK